MLLIIVVLAGLPIHGQEKRPETNKKSQSSNGVEQPNAPTSQIVVINEQTSDRDKGNPHDNSDSYFHHLISPEVLTAIGLLVVVCIGTCATIKTLKAIQRQGVIMIQQARIFQRQAETMERQTVATKIAADAALDNAQAVIKAQRPWLFIPMGDEFSKIGDPALPDASENRIAFVKFDLRNFGQSPARVVEKKVWMYIGDSPNSIPDVSAYNSQDADPDNYVIPQNSMVAVEARLYPAGYVTPKDKAAILVGAKHLWLCGYFNYRNAAEGSDGEVYRTQLAYMWIHKSLRPKPFWILRGPKEYSNAT